MLVFHGLEIFPQVGQPPIEQVSRLVAAPIQVRGDLRDVQVQEIEFYDLAPGTDEPVDGFADDVLERFLLDSLPTIGESLFGYPPQFFMMVEIIIPSTFAELVDDRGTHDLLDIGGRAQDSPVGANELPQSYLYVLEDILGVQTVFREIVALDLDVHVLGIIVEDSPEFFFLKGGRIHGSYQILFGYNCLFY